MNILNGIAEFDFFKTRCFILLGLAGFFHQESNAQQIHGRDDIWFLMINTYKINDKWDVGNELHMRFDDYLNDDQQFIVRPFFNYHAANGKVVYSGGYSYIRTYPYGQFPLPITKPEHNVWEQIVFNQKIGKSSLSHRYRMEHRWQGNLAGQADGSFQVDGYDFSNRFRYRLTFKHDINERWFFSAFDELFINISDDWLITGFDRNWIYVGFGYHFNKRVALQGGYMHHYAKNTPDRYERHPTLQFILDWRLN